MQDIKYEQQIINTDNNITVGGVIGVELSNQITDIISYEMHKLHLLAEFNWQFNNNADDIVRQSTFYIPSCYNKIEIIGEVKFPSNTIGVANTTRTFQIEVNDQEYQITDFVDIEDMLDDKGVSKFKYLIPSSFSGFNPDDFFDENTLDKIYCKMVIRNDSTPSAPFVEGYLRVKIYGRMI